MEENVKSALVANTKGKNKICNSFAEKLFGEKKGKGKKRWAQQQRGKLEKESSTLPTLPKRYSFREVLLVHVKS